MFEKASRMKIRFATAKGMLTVEDLWDLPLYSTSEGRVTLDSIAVQLHEKLSSVSARVSFVNPESATTPEEQLKFDIVRHIIDVRIKERDEAQTAAANRERKQNLLALIAKKEGQALEEISLDDLKKMVEAM